MLLKLTTENERISELWTLPMYEKYDACKGLGPHVQKSVLAVIRNKGQTRLQHGISICWLSTHWLVLIINIRVKFCWHGYVTGHLESVANANKIGDRFCANQLPLHPCTYELSFTTILAILPPGEINGAVRVNDDENATICYRSCGKNIWSSQHVYGAPRALFVVTMRRPAGD